MATPMPPTNCHFCSTGQKSWLNLTPCQLRYDQPLLRRCQRQLKRMEQTLPLGVQHHQLNCFPCSQGTKSKTLNVPINSPLSIKDMCISWLRHVSLLDQESFHRWPRNCTVIHCVNFLVVSELSNLVLRE